MDTQTQQQNIEFACHSLYINYARYVDSGQYDDFVALFTDEAVMLKGPAGVGHYSNTFRRTEAGWRIDDAKTKVAISYCDGWRRSSLVHGFKTWCTGTYPYQ